MITVVMMVVVCARTCVYLAGRWWVMLGRKKKTDLSQALHTSPDLPSSPFNLFKALPQTDFWAHHQAFATTS